MEVWQIRYLFSETQQRVDQCGYELELGKWNLLSKEANSGSVSEENPAAQVKAPVLRLVGVSGVGLSQTER